MKTLAIISEFNPFHNGHKYLLEKSIEITKADLALTIMSGDFVQRGEPAIIDKFSRADSAIECGFDLVIEMPNFVSLQSAKFFAQKNIEILDKLGVDCLAFGIENISSEDFIIKIEKIYNNRDDFEKFTREFLKEGYSYTKSSYMSLEKIIGDKSFLTSNNILAVEYINAIKSLNSKIKFYSIERKGAYNKDKHIKNDNFASSTAIRSSIYDKNIENLIPLPSLKALKNFYGEYDKFPLIEDFYEILKYKLIIERQKMNDILCYEDGMENLFYKNIKNSKSFEDFVNSSTSTRFTSSRIKRLAINYLIDNKLTLNKIDMNFVKVLASNKKGMEFIAKANIKRIISKRDLDILTNDEKIIVNSNIVASNLYNMAIGRPIDYDFIRKFSLK